MSGTGRLVIVSGPSGVGKDTVIDLWKQANPNVQRVVAYTTRSPREGEVNGIDYHFVSVEQFHQKANQGDFLEFKEVHGNWYATPLTDMLKMVEDGKIAILKIDVQGAIEAKRLRPEILTIFLLPPSDEELERRIRSRGTDSDEVIAKRLQNARDEIAISPQYQFRIVNADLNSTIAQLEEIVK
jgi:guanylate kinase